MRTFEMTDIEAPASIFENANSPVTLNFQDVVYNVKIKDGGCFGNSSKSKEKNILKGITGIVYPGEMLAMLGPSGSGKTTLLTALGGRLGRIQGGTISYNGKSFNNTMKRMTGFVTQDDVLYPHLTVTETLIFTALLRLPNNITKGDKIKHAETVLSQLGLTRCKDSIIGGPRLRGVSGGERKRVSIGQEMLINPSLLFLDEPTSGLDSTTSQNIVSTLWELANGGRTIVMTIHQPSSRLFYMFHKVLLLSEGNPLYFGKGSESIDYFASIGFVPHVAMNPSDFLLDLANGVLGDESSGDMSTIKETLVSAYKTNIERNLKEEVEQENAYMSEKTNENPVQHWPTTWWQQFSVLLRRGIKERKHEAFSIYTIGQVLVTAFLCGLLWWKSSVAQLQDQIGLLFFVCSFWNFFPLYQAIFTFPDERMMIEKERTSGMYRLSSYFIASIVRDLPMELFLPIIFNVIVYFMTNLKRTTIAFFYYLFSLLLNVLVSQGLGLALGATFMNLKTATTLGSVTILTLSLAGGYFVLNVPAFISWIKYLSMSNYTYKLLLGSQYEVGQTYPCDGKTCLIEDFPTIKPIGLDGQVISAIALAIMLVGYRLIAYIALMRIGVTRK